MPAQPSTSKRGQTWLRPVCSTALIVSVLAIVSYFSNNGSPTRGSDASPLVARGATTKSCRDVYYTEDRCSFVKNNCEDEQPGIISYLTIYYCDFNYNRFAGFALLTLWLGLLFSTIGIAASDFFSPNLQTIANVLSMPENLAGVTFLAIGNGSPDVFSTVMAMRSNSAAMAVGELIGAASFITAIVAGTIGCVTEFKVGKSSFIRDLIFFIAAVCITMGFLIDGHLYPLECIFMIGYYVFYVAVVGMSHWYTTRRARRRALVDAEAARLSGSSRQVGFEPYRDGPEEATPPIPSTRTSATVQTATYGAPRISVDGAMDFEEVEDERRRHRAAEIAGNMRIRRPTYGRRSTHSFIRPSLVGALEFKSTIDHFRKEEALGGSGSSHGHGRSHSAHNLPRAARRPESQTPRLGSPSGPIISVAETSPTGRERAVSYGVYGGPLTHELTVYSEEDEATQGEASTSSYPFPQLVPDTTVRTPSPAGSLAVPGTASEPATRQNSGASGSTTRSLVMEPLRLQIPSRRSSASGRSETLSPFPGLTDSPQPMTPNSEIGMPQFELPATPAQEAESEEIRPRWRWWPYSVLPGPEDVVSTLFPTLQGWNDKGAVDMVLSAISVPSVFLLSVTLPVVESRGDDECSTSADDGELQTLAAREETEWDRFRRRTRSGTIRSSAASLAGVDGREEVRPVVQGILPKAVRRPSQLVSAPQKDGHLPGDEDSWNRWQVLVQIALGPTFAMFIITFVLLEQTMAVIKWCLIYTAIASVVCLVFILIATTPEKRPKYHNLLCFPGFLVSVAWIVAIAGEVVGVLKAMGVILAISEAILGLTIFAAGNSVGDWVSNYTIARLGSPVMAFSGCIGGPMLNILLGIGIGGLVAMATKANHKHKKHPDRPITYQPYKIQISPTLLVSAAALLITLLAFLIFVPRNKWQFSRRLGIGLIILWCICTTCNLIIEGTGVWTESSS